MVRKLSTREIITYHFSNRPDQIIYIAWSQSIRDLSQLCRELEDEGTFESVESNVLMDVRYYAGYKKDMPAVRLGSKGQERKG